MNSLVVFLLIIVLVGVLVFFTGRRLGPLILALTAGSFLADLWSDWLRILIGGFGVGVSWLPNGVIATVILTLLPMIILLFGGPIYYKKWEKVAAAVVLALFVGVLLMRPLGRYLLLNGTAEAVYGMVNAWWKYIITAGLIVGIVDMFLLHTAKPSIKSKKH